MTGQIESYAFCEGVARKQAKNFYYSFLLLDQDRRRAMCAIYAFMRYCDDLSDAAGIADRGLAIAQWRQELDAGFCRRLAGERAVAGVSAHGGSLQDPALLLFRDDRGRQL